jgi:hypothetical protein
MDGLMSRDSFRESVFKRDNYECVLCKEPAQDAHHIVERRLFDDGGYYLNNGVSVCGPCHIKCEETTVSCSEVREAAGIEKTILPLHLYPDQEYDKWGNPILPNGMRLRGELFGDESVQKILKQGNVLHLFSKYVKYPRTYHLPWSPGLTNDDRLMPSLKAFEGQRVVVTIKMDGENTSWYNDHTHVRSLDKTSPHGSRAWAKNMWSNISYEIPEGWRICVENVYAKHSIHYKNLESFVYGFSIWNENNICLSWDETVEWFELLGITPSPVIYDGIWDEETIKGLYTSTFNGDECEGYVVRVADAFPFTDFRKKLGKYVRANHVQTHGHWIREAMVVNELRGESNEGNED